MKKKIRKRTAIIGASIVAALILIVFFSTVFHREAQPMVIQQFFEEAKSNTYFKNAFVTGKQEQIVFMNVSPLTNPKNEIGTETHAFDQAIIIVDGNGKAILNGRTSLIKEGDMIFIPKGTTHNIINLDQEKDLKLISFYSQNDIPKGAKYKKMSDEPQKIKTTELDRKKAKVKSVAEKK